jgi:hypothetical protein
VQFAAAEVRTLRQRVVAFGKVGAISPVLEDAPRPVEVVIYSNSTASPAAASSLGIAIVPEPISVPARPVAAGAAPSQPAAPITLGLAVGAVAPALPLARFTGTIAAIEPIEDEAAQRVRIELTDPGHVLRSGMTIEVQIEIDLAARLVIPARAIMYAGSRRLAFVDRGDDGRAGVELREIGVGVIDSGLAEVRSGLSAGQRVVTDGTFLLAAESRIKSSSPLWDDRPARHTRPGTSESTKRAAAAPAAPTAPKAGPTPPASTTASTPAGGGW